jgi:hypothetical protein
MEETSASTHATAHHRTGWDTFFIGLWFVVVCLYGLGLVDNLAHGFSSATVGWLEILYNAFLLSPTIVAGAGLMLWKLPGNLVGRLALLIALGGVGWLFTYNDETSLLTGWILVAQFVYWSGVGFPALIYLMYVFPTGQVHPRRWQTPLLILGIAQFAGALLEYASLSPAQFSRMTTRDVPNPLFFPALEPLAGIMQWFGEYGIFVFVLLAGGILSIRSRYRLSTRKERQQIKWAAWGFGQLGFALAVVAVTSIVSADSGEGWERSGWVLMVSLVALAASVGISVFRYQLWDIDLVIRRTLLYTALTSALALVYFASVIAIQFILRLLSGEVGQSQPAIVVSTLLVAALFTPLRARIRDSLDQRFYRRRYDAEVAIQSFSAALRDEVNLEHLSGHLLATMQETLQPENASLWLRKPKT